MFKTTDQIETAWFKSIDHLNGLMYNLKWESERGNGDNHSSKIGLYLSQIFLATSDAMKLNVELTKRELAEVAE
jgi:hypothetical protein